MRGKEEAHDYRYFPDPDLLPVLISDQEMAAWKAEIPELPRVRLERFIQMTGLPEAECEILVQNKELADFFEEASRLASPRKVANYILGPMSREANESHKSLTPSHWKMTPEHLAELIEIVEAGTISAKIANDIFPDLLTGTESPRQYVTSHGLAQISDSGELERLVDEIFSANPK